MADFNPQFQSSDPSYLGWSKPIQQPIADKSTGIALEATGNALDAGVKIADTQVKGIIKNDLETQIDQKRTTFNNQLDSLLGNTSSNPTANAQDLMPDKNNPPGDVSRALGTVQRLQDAKDQAGKFRTTALDANLTQTLKDVRSQYPGYRDYIDEQAGRIIGYNPANKLVADKIAQLNELASKKNTENEYWTRQLVNSGADGSQDVLNTFKQDGDTNKVENFLTKTNIAQQRVKDDIQTYTLSEKTDANRQSKAEQAAYSILDHAMSSYYYNDRIIRQGDPSKYPTSSEAGDKLIELSANPNGRDAVAIQNLGMQIQGLASRNQQQAMVQLQNAKTADGKSLYDTLGPKRVNEILKETNDKLYGTQMTLLKDGNLGLLSSVNKTIGAIKDNDAFQALTDPSTSGITRTATTLNTLFPNMSTDLIKTVVGQGNTYTGKLMELTGTQKQQALTQTGGSFAGNGPGGKIYTFKQYQAEQDKAQKMPGVLESDAQKAAATKDFLGLTKAFTEKDPRIVDAAITTFFDPTNRGTMDKYMDDYYDKSRGVIVKGRTGIFGDLTSPEITKSVWSRSQNGNGTAWEFYKGWARGEAIPELKDMAKTWQSNEVQFDNKSQTGIPGSDHHFYWDTDKGQIGITDIRGVPIDTNTSWRMNPDLFAVRNANITLNRLGHIAEQEGSDKNAFLIDAMRQAGWGDVSRLNDFDARGGKTIDQKIIKAITVAHTPPKPEVK